MQNMNHALSGGEEAKQKEKDLISDIKMLTPEKLETQGMQTQLHKNNWAALKAKGGQ